MPKQGTDEIQQLVSINESARKLFVEPEISAPVDILESDIVLSSHSWSPRRRGRHHGLAGFTRDVWNLVEKSGGAQESLRAG